jgi:hypothetical protein
MKLNWLKTAWGTENMETENDAQELLQKRPSLASLFDYVIDWSQWAVAAILAVGVARVIWRVQFFNF